MMATPVPEARMRVGASAPVTPRRVLATRNATWAIALAAWLGRSGVRPNAVSVGGVAAAAAAGAAFAIGPALTPLGQATALLIAAACVQLRLLCNLLDGMLAVEGALKTPNGEIFNDLPDRLEDVVILVGAGFSVHQVPGGMALGWAASVAAVLTAYVRVLGGSLGMPQHFIGPMAKQHRMFTITLAAILAAVETLVGLPPRAIVCGLAVIAIGSIVTVVRRTRRIADGLKQSWLRP
jgi:phosphatidylglycerophosphate synthase